jgi:SlyX protein
MSDPDKFDLKAFSDRLDALEARVAFQDDTIETLNTTITEQWAKIDALTRQLLALSERLAEAETQLPRTPNEPPPHY